MSLDRVPVSRAPVSRCLPVLPVLPIPPGTHWSDATPIVLPGMGEEEEQPAMLEAPAGRAAKPKPAKPKPAPAVPGRPPATGIASGGLWFAPPVLPPAPAAEPAAPKPRQAKPVKKNNPKLVAAARELRDRWLEQVNAGRYLPITAEKYELGRLAGEGPEAGELRQLEQPRPLLALPAA